MIKVACIIFHKNTSRYPAQWVEKCINSIKNQTFKNFTVFEVDYGNSNTQIYEGSIFESLELKNHAVAHNYLLDKVFGLGYDIAMNVNLDDFYDVKRFELQVAKIKEGYELVSSNFYVIDERENVVKTNVFHNLNFFEEAEKGHNIIAHPSCCYSKKFWDNCTKLIDTEIPRDDFELWKRTFIKGENKFCILPEFLLYYRVHNLKTS